MRKVYQVQKSERISRDSQHLLLMFKIIQHLIPSQHCLSIRGRSGRVMSVVSGSRAFHWQNCWALEEALLSDSGISLHKEAAVVAIRSPALRTINQVQQRWSSSTEKHTASCRRIILLCANTLGRHHIQFQSVTSLPTQQSSPYAAMLGYWP